MRKLTKGRLATVLVYGLALGMLLPGLGTYGATAVAARARAQVIVLPLANLTEKGGAELAQRVQDALRVGLAASGRASILRLDPANPAVRRAIDIERSIEPSELKFDLPIDQKEAVKVGRALDADMVLYGSIHEYAYDANKQTLTIGLTIHPLDPRTGEPGTTISCSGKAVGGPGYTGGEGPLITEAIDNAVAQVVEGTVGAAIAPGATQAPPKAGLAVTRKKDKTWQTLGALLAVAAVIALASHQGGGAAAAVAPPGVVTDAVATPTANSVSLTWSVPSTVSGIASFNIYRAEMGGVSRMVRSGRAPGSRVRLTRQAATYSLLANVGRSDRAYNDGSAAVGTLYAYHITTITSNAESQPVDFFNFYEPLGTIEVGPDYPRAPAMPTATPYRNSIQLSWERNPEPFINAYRVYRASSASGPWDNTTLVPNGQVSASESSLTDPGPLTAGRTYFYAVGAVTIATGVNGRVGPAREVLFEIGPPAPPTNVVVSPRISGVFISWSASPDTTVTGYNIYRNGTKLVPPSPTTALSYLDSPLAAGVYAYEVSAVAGTPPVESVRVASAPPTISPGSPPFGLALTPPTPVVANGTDTTDIIATVTNTTGGPSQGVEVTFSAANTGGGALTEHPSYPATQSGSDLKVITNAAGKAAVRFRAGSTYPVSPAPTVTATCAGVNAGGSPVTLTAQVTITLQPRLVGQVTLTAASSVLVADGISSTTLTATVTDQGGGPFAGINVEFASQNLAVGVVAPPSGVTDANGQTTTTLTSAGPTVGDCTVTATAVDAPEGVEPGQVTVRFVTAPQVTVSVQPSTLPAAGMGASALITATAKHSNGEPVADGTVIRFGFESGGAQPSLISVTGAQIVAGRERALTRDAVAYSTMFSAADLANGDSDLVVAWIDFNDDGLRDVSEPRGNASVTYTEPPYRLTLSAEPLSIPADGRSVTKLVADVRTAVPDPSGSGLRPVADGTVVTFSTTAGTFQPGGEATAIGYTVGGLVTAFLQSSTQQGIANVSATAALISGSTPVEFTAPVSLVVMVSANPTSLQADGKATSQILVRVTNNAGQPQAAAAVSLSTSLGSVSETSLTTDTNGQATVTFTAGTVAGTATVLASSGGASGFTTLTLTSGQAQNASMTIIAPGYVLPATNGLPSLSGASPTASVVTRVTDKFGNPVVDGTPVFFHTDIGQITGSVPTANGVATATLTTGNFLDATNKATYRPGWATVSSYANNPAGTASSGPQYQIFCGDASTVTWDGSATNTNFWIPNGADWRFGGRPDSPANQPNIYFRAGDDIFLDTILADQNNNPLPGGCTVVYAVYVDGKHLTDITDTTGIILSALGPICTAASESACVTLGRFPADTDLPYAFLEVVMGSPAAVDTTLSLTIGQYVGAAAPFGTITITCDDGTQWDNGTYHVISATVRDKFGNRVQDGTLINFGVQNANNVSVVFTENPVKTINGVATLAVACNLINQATGGSVSILAGAPQNPPRSDALGSIGISVPATPPVRHTVLVDYAPDKATLVETYDASVPGFHSIENAFSITNTGEAAETVYVDNTPGGAYPAGYITFRVHADGEPNPPVAYGGLPLLLSGMAPGTQVWIDVIVNTTGLTVAGSPHTSTIAVTSTATVTYAPATGAQKTSISVQFP